MIARQLIRNAALALAALVLGTGCVSVGTMQQANTVGKGNSQFAAEPAFWGMAVKGAGNTTLPNASFAARFGVSDTVDLGFRVGLAGFEGTSKFQLTDPTGGIVVSVAPSLGGMLFTFPGIGSSTDALGVMSLNLPVLIGIPLGRHQLVLGPSVRNLLLFGGDTTNGAVGNMMSVGVTVGLALRLSDSFKMIPEVGVLVPTLVTAGARNVEISSQALGGELAFFQIGCGLVWGKSR